ncbi:MAG TPA: ATP-dependent DNA helicase RecG [Candidatus Paceibacterota bacterium]|nr:ATP-dependent DNA helicase RecG [Candidatus Paceibacterota bacterium]
MSPNDELANVFRLTPPQKAALRKLGVHAVLDLLYHFPARYDEAGGEESIGGLVAGQEATVFGTIKKLDTRRSWSRRIPIGEAVIEDGSGSVKVMWFHQPYLAKKFSEGTFVKAVGTVSGKENKLYLANPHVEAADPADTGLFSSKKAGAKNERQLFAVYPESRGVTSLWFRHAIERAMNSGVLEKIEDPVPAATLAKYNLPDIRSALRYIHAPENIRHAEAARKRFSFEEIYTIQVARALERASNNAQRSFRIPDAEEAADTFITSIPFPPTSAQTRAIREICADLDKGAPMARLLEGDVGSGKTLVAAASIYAVVTSRPPGRESGTLQVAYMAPTEILAQQHFDSFVEYFRDLPINIGLITGSGCKKFPSKSSPGNATAISRAQLLKWAVNGEIALLVGTHALIQKSVLFQHLAYAIVDEQHRFGTRQRRELAQKSRADMGTLPHFLSMTATPIPRTLALTIYGDLDISVLDELPPGRAKIETKIVPARERGAAYEALRARLREDRQAYVICPRIDEPDPEKQNAIQAKSVKAESVRLKKEVFPEFEVGILHGAMKPKEKDDVMRDFVSGSIDILVATSVVEVGVNVPNATCIVIEGAERFGLSQLHQLRGRVMRSSHPPLCFLFTDSKSEISLKRLCALASTQDGFKLAEADLENRGAGDLFGRSQWGVSDIGMEALKNPRLIAAAREEALDLVAHGHPLSDALTRRVQRITGELHAE